jgi:Spy/CpxP family protein refolding chaperone
MNIKKTITTAAIAVGLATAGFAAQDGRHGRGFGHRGGMFERAGAALNLTDTQKEFAKQLAADTRTQAKPIMQELRQNRQDLAAAVKANNPTAINTLTQRQGELSAQLSALHAKSMASFYAQLTPEQRVKADEMHSRMKDRGNNFSERRGKRGAAAEAK